MAKPAAGVPDDALLSVRTAGYCLECDGIVERASDGGCANGHDAESVTGRIVLVDDDPMPQIPRFNWGAFALPFIWGPAHDQWAAALFLPIWLFMDSIIGTASAGGVPATIGGSIVVALTLAMQAFFARRANGLAFRRVVDHMTAEEFTRRERLWTWVCVPVALLLVAWMLWYRFVVAPTLPH